LPELTSLPISSSLGLRCGSGKSSLVNCTIVRQLEDFDPFKYGLMQALSDLKQLSDCGESIEHVLTPNTGLWAICTRHDMMKAVHRSITCLSKAGCEHLSARMVETEVHAGRGALFQDLVASDVTDCIMS